MEACSIKEGGTQVTQLGVIHFDKIETVRVDQITEQDSIRAGSDSLDELLGYLNSKDGTIYKITLHLGGQDPRIALREKTTLSKDDFDEITKKLTRLDKASKRGPWTDPILKLIVDYPERRAGDLAEMMDQDKPWFKLQVRKLKNLGLTISLGVGYKISPRGQAFLKMKYTEFE